MNYTSMTFWALFAPLWLIYWRLSHRRQNALLLFASYAFYGLWDWRFLFLIMLSTVIDYVGGLGVAGIAVPWRMRAKLWVLLTGGALLVMGGLPGRPIVLPAATAVLFGSYFLLLPRLYSAREETRRRTFLVLSMAVNLAILGFFKYFDFFLDSAVKLGRTFGFEMHASTLGILLPAGISFYTFQTMSYTIDIYRRETEPTRAFEDYALFVCFFPHLVAGPIMRATTLLPQVVQPRMRRDGDMEEGLLLVLVGLFKKIVIADNLAPMANAVFFRFGGGQAEGVTGGDALVALYAFAFQIYGDFSGYSAIARGISKWLGFDLVINFRLPYLAVSPSDFWRRWHVSLSTWLRDYLYIPLGGNRGGAAATYRNIMITMLLGGLWHGASWTFVAWGCYHGAILCAFRAMGVGDAIPVGSLMGWVMRLGKMLLMFHLTCLGWLLFRSETFSAAVAMGVRIVSDFRWTASTVAGFGMVLFHVLPLLGFELATKGEERLDRLTRWPWPVQGLTWASLVLALFLFSSRETYEFIYFQF